MRYRAALTEPLGFDVAALVAADLVCCNRARVEDIDIVAMRDAVKRDAERVCAMPGARPTGTPR